MRTCTEFLFLQTCTETPGPGSGSLCGRGPVVAQHDVEGPGEVVGERAAAPFVHERQQEGEEQQSEEEEPQEESQAADPLQQPGFLQTHTEHTERVHKDLDQSG